MNLPTVYRRSLIDEQAGISFQGPAGTLVKPSPTKMLTITMNNCFIVYVPYKDRDTGFSTRNMNKVDMRSPPEIEPELGSVG